MFFIFEQTVARGNALVQNLNSGTDFCFNLLLCLTECDFTLTFLMKHLVSNRDLCHTVDDEVAVAVAVKRCCHAISTPEIVMHDRASVQLMTIANNRKENSISFFQTSFSFSNNLHGNLKPTCTFCRKNDWFAGREIILVCSDQSLA